MEYVLRVAVERVHRKVSKHQIIIHKSLKIAINEAGTHDEDDNQC